MALVFLIELQKFFFFSKCFPKSFMFFLFYEKNDYSLDGLVTFKDAAAGDLDGIFFSLLSSFVSDNKYGCIFRLVNSKVSKLFKILTFF